MPNGGRQLQFVLIGDGIQITYTQVTGLEHSSQTLSYQGPDGNRSFSGDQVSSEKSRLGTLLTVVLFPVSPETRDASTVTLSLLLPGIELMETNKQPIMTVAIRMTTPPGFPPPQPGTQQTYQVYNLEGTVTLSLLP